MNARLRARVPTGLVVAVVVVVVVIAGAGIAVTVGDFSPAGLEVNGERVSQQTIDSELSGFAESTYFGESFANGGATFKTTNGALNSIAATQWLAFRIENSLAERALEDAGEPLSDQDLRQARETLGGQGVLDGMSDDAATQLTRLQASITKLVETTGSQDAARDAVAKLARRADVSVAGRYGSWNAEQLGVCPPSGCDRVVTVLPPAGQ